MTSIYFDNIVEATDISTRRNAPTHGVHRTAIALAMVAVAWFVIAMAIAFGGGVEADYVLAIVVLFAVIFFGLTLGIAARNARDPRWSEGPVSFAEFVDDNVATYTGRIAGREAMLELLTLPITLALGATAIGLVFALSF